jgi:hypothetical protein
LPYIIPTTSPACHCEKPENPTVGDPQFGNSRVPAGLLLLETLQAACLAHKYQVTNVVSQQAVEDIGRFNFCGASGDERAGVRQRLDESVL